MAEVCRVRSETAEAFKKGLLIGLSKGHAKAGKDVNEIAIVVFIAATGVERDNSLNSPRRVRPPAPPVVLQRAERTACRANRQALQCLPSTRKPRHGLATQRVLHWLVAVGV